MGSLFGGGDKKTTQKYTPPSWVQDAAKGALGTAQNIQNRQYQPYTGQRVAGMSGNERMALDLARQGSGQWQGDLDKARGFLDRAGQKFTDADIQAYMNPYIKGALDPAARELNEDTQRRMNALRSQQASRGAFGGGRATLMEQETVRGGQEALSDLYGRGYAQAFESGANRWAADRENDRVQAQSYIATAAQQAGLMNQDIANLISTGVIDRQIRQAAQDFDYQQFVEGRDWDVRNLGIMIDTLKGIKGSYDEVTKTTQKTEGNTLGQLFGGASAILGGLDLDWGDVIRMGAAYFTGGGSEVAWAGYTDSDVRLKDNIRQIGPRLYEWDWNDTARQLGIDHQPTTGELAQEVLEYAPERVRIGPHGFLQIRRDS